jgi:hypothetical protein
LARWQYHFEKGNSEAVLSALSCYQNTDGGFGHALEADAWNPNSTPIQTWSATEVLREINFTNNTHTIIKGILHYLESGQNFDGKFWYKIVKSNNDYPHAPWWHTEIDSTDHNDYNPTACLAGFIIRFTEKNSELHNMLPHCVRSIAHCGQQKGKRMHTLSCYLRLNNILGAKQLDIMFCTP